MKKIDSVHNKQYHIIIEKQPFLKVKSFAGIEYNSLTLILGFLVPLVSFVLGFLSALFIEKLREKKDIEIASDSFLIWIERTIKSCKSLSLELEKRKNEALSLDGFLVSKPDFINLHLNRLSLDQNSLYKGFVKLKKGAQKENFNDYSKIIVELDFLGDFQKALSANSQYIIDDFDRQFNQWNDSVKSLHKKKHILIGRRATNNESKLTVINDCFNDWYKINQEGLSNTNEFLRKVRTDFANVLSR